MEIMKGSATRQKTSRKESPETGSVNGFMLSLAQTVITIGKTLPENEWKAILNLEQS